MEPVTDIIHPRIYVACLAAYNDGHLHGRWIDADQSVEAIWEEICVMLDESPCPDAEEYAIHDHEGFEGVHIEEYAGLTRITALAAFISEHGKLGAEVLAYYGGDIEETCRALDDRYAGCYASLADFAEELTEQAIDVPESLRFYIDYERMARDMAISDVTTVETGFEQVHVFWSR